jgi:hypothetical protein
MKLKLLLFCCFVGFNFSSQTTADYRSDLVHFSMVGEYVFSGNPSNTMKILQQSEGFRVELVGGGKDSSGAGTSADCVIHAYGIVKGNQMTATFAAIDTDTFLYTDAQAKAENRKVEIKFARGRVTVLHADTLGYCGYGATFLGIYRRRN